MFNLYPFLSVACWSQGPDVGYRSIMASESPYIYGDGYQDHQKRLEISPLFEEQNINLDIMI